ncbi:flagellar hook-associated protein 3 FlgL [Poseidonocella pacifica]|uniref:Flagellar hook-associated protein 3 FlgL n=1 Tax=Poseidonocella pacifica TaxID=871651 RepID=A0A1I0XVM8_9RHOB|nr:flagellin [Poseidonocella pacifica]SFB05179.1 flagellar hook-associated protein 3 FlgL [Poseidonocella pacifica]
MNISSLGDLAQSYVTRKRNAEIRQDINTLTDQLASNRISDLAASLQGDFGQLASLERSLTTLDTYQVATNEAAFFMETQQLTLENVMGGLDTAVEAMLTAANSTFSSVLNAASIEADTQFKTLVSSLNVPAGGRSLFSGDATGDPALRPAQEILDELSTLVSGMTDLDSIETALDTWFKDPAGGYETWAYTGSTDEMEPFMIGDGREVGPGVTALDGGIRDTLKALAMGALMKDNLVTSNITLRGQVLGRTAELGLSSKATLTDTRSKVGTVQAQLEYQTTRISAEHSAFSIARSLLVTADPFETATLLENAQFQLESLYVATASSSRLSLMDYLM